ncbi:hypothetical protein [Neolewinella sp.]|uniref:hypothetical protein n=1 Tax=Neolewinella sp. TaxID=2993543 RepID=UPI003B52AFCE
MPNQHTIPFKTRSELAAECGINPRTVSRHLHKICPNLPKRQLLSPGYQKRFYDHYGWPFSVDKQLYCNVLPPPPNSLIDRCLATST